ncbi:MAG: hypothetical protein ABI794_13410 [Betaproteobacteria bacterium]
MYALPAALVLALTSVGRADADEMEPVTVTVEWTAEKCDFVLTKDEYGHGVVRKLSPVTLEAGEVLVGNLSRINFSGRVIKQATGEATMMRGMRYGVRRKEAVRTIVEWSRYCKPPLE